MSDELKITDLDSELKKIFLDIFKDEMKALPKSDEKIVAWINESPILRSLINDKYLTQKRSLASTAP